jgi:hypothetical protein
MNEPDMLLYTIQYLSNTVLSPEHIRGNPKTMKIHLSEMKLSRVGGNPLW